MVSICRKNSEYEGCTQDKASKGIPDTAATTKIVVLTFEYKNIGTVATEIDFYFSAVFNEEFIDVDSSVVPKDLIGKKLLPNASAKGLVYISVPKYFEMKDVLLYFEGFDADSNDYYIAVK
jgi:hypothetical protein